MANAAVRQLMDQGARSGDPTVLAVELRSVLDGYTHTVLDDGYAQNDPDKMKGGRHRLVEALRKRAPDGRGVFFPTAPATAWRDRDGNTYAPPDLLVERGVWDSECERRLAVYAPEREALAREGEARLKNRLEAQDRDTPRVGKGRRVPQ